MIDIQSILPSMIDAVWSDVKGYLQDIVDHSNDTLTLELIYRSVMERDMQAYVAVDEQSNIVGAVLTEIRLKPNDMKVLTVIGVAGDRFTDWMPEGDRLMRQLAHTFHTPVVEMYGRRGWVRKLANSGWKEQAVVMRLDLRN